jgi:ABC-2 type transport system permease protein
MDVHRDVIWMSGFFVLGMVAAAVRFKKRLD